MKNLVVTVGACLLAVFLYASGYASAQAHEEPLTVYCDASTESQIEVGCYTFHTLSDQIMAYSYLTRGADIIFTLSTPLIHEGGRTPILSKKKTEVLDLIERWRSALSVVSSTNRPDWYPPSRLPGDTVWLYPTRATD